MNANTVIKVKTGDYVKFGELNLFAGQIISLNRNTATVRINEWQTAVVGIAAIMLVNNRRVGSTDSLAIA